MIWNLGPGLTTDNGRVPPVASKIPNQAETLGNKIRTIPEMGLFYIYEDVFVTVQMQREPEGDPLQG
jgi:hypothetical protein